MTDTDDALYDTIQSALDNALHEVFQQHEQAYTTRWVGVVESVTPDGVRGVWTFAEGSMHEWEIKGMLTEALDRQRLMGIRRAVQGED